MACAVLTEWGLLFFVGSSSLRWKAYMKRNPVFF